MPRTTGKEQGWRCQRHAVRFLLAHGYEEAAGVLKITSLSRQSRMRTLKLEGEILEPWVSTVRDACGRRRLQL